MVVADTHLGVPFQSPDTESAWIVALQGFWTSAFTVGEAEGSADLPDLPDLASTTGSSVGAAAPGQCGRGEEGGHREGKSW